MHRSTYAISTFSLLTILAGCASTHDETDETTDALRNLEPGEILGSIAPGETKSVHYTPTPRYRAFRFSGKAGDNIEIWVRGKNGSDPKALLLGGNYSTLAQNDNAAATTKDAHITSKLTTTGSYYIALREVDEESSPVSDFTVSLNPKTSAPPPPPPTTDPFSSNWCTGTPLSNAQILKYYAPGQFGDTTLGTAKVMLRMRTCTGLATCSAWTVEEASPAATQRLSVVGSGNIYSTPLVAKFANDSANPISLRLYGTYQLSEWAPYGGTGSVTLIPSSTLSHAVFSATHESATSPISVILTEHCFWGKISTVRNFVEAEAALLGKIDPPK